MMMQVALLVELITLIFSIPVLALSYYWIVLFGASLVYPRKLGKEDVRLNSYPKVSILIASFNEKFVIERSLEAMKHLNYPRSKIQVVVADDSTDQTVHLIDQKIRDLIKSGVNAVISRRAAREYFKCGALNTAMEMVEGEYVLLLDADSVVPPDILIKGINALESHSRASFVSFRYGHYNRDYNTVTRLFALSQDIGDTLSKMGAYRIDAPFSCQGGFTLVRTRDLRAVGQWSNDRIADDTDISIKMYLAGKRGIYLSNTSIMSEDPSTLEAWKKQVARTSQGWWRCIARYWSKILFARGVSIQKKVGMFLMLIAPFTSLSWIVVTFLSAFTLLLGLVAPSDSIFSNPIYIAIVAIPFGISLLSGLWALWVQDLLTVKNAVLIPMLSYATGCMMTLGSIGFFYGVFDRLGFFLYRTPKSGNEKEMTKTKYFRNLSSDRNTLVEAIVSISAIGLGILVFFHGVWFLSVSMIGFGGFTLKSMNLTRGLRDTETSELGEGSLIAPKITVNN
ncbi:MAG TPA: glycosyltransferase family 2 protein [Nitrososphaerales archaeon]|nr:glycosyltransferase family 2 protein [Nitrososphaerales archaeon]